MTHFLLHRTVMAVPGISATIAHPYELLAAAATGLFCHNAIFIHGEWHQQVTSLLGLHAAAITLVTLFEATYQGLSPVSSFNASLIVVGTYGVFFFASMIIYRTFFHRLRHFPGPVLARWSKFWHVFQCWDSRNHLLMENLRRQYGDFVRIGMQ